MSTEKSAATVKPAAKPKPAGNGPFQRGQKYLGEVMTELKKTSWPSRAELISQTQVVLGVLVAVGVFIWIWDFILTKIFEGILRVLGINQ